MGEEDMQSRTDYECLEERTVHLKDIKEKQCRYPFGDTNTGYTFCGKDTAEGSSYCVDHRKACIRKYK